MKTLLRESHVVRGGSGPCTNPCITQPWGPCRWLQRRPRTTTEAFYFLSYSQGYRSKRSRTICGRSSSAELARAPALTLQTLLELWSLFILHAEVGLHLLSTPHNTIMPTAMSYLPLPDLLMVSLNIRPPVRGPAKQPGLRTEKRRAPVGHPVVIFSPIPGQQGEGKAGVGGSPALESYFFSLCSRSTECF